MKRKLVLIVTMVLLLGSLLVPNTILAADNTVAGSEEGLAQKAAQVWLDYAGGQNSEVSQWQDASVVSPQAYHNLKGEVVAFLFTIVGKGGTAGYIMVGNSSYGNIVFEASEAAPPTLPNSEKVKAVAESLGISVYGEINAEPVDFVYIGPGGFIAIYSIEKQKIAINIIQKTAFLASDLKSILLSPEEQRKSAAETEQQKGNAILSGYKILSLQYYQPGGGACGPCAGVSIGRYYRVYHGGYSNLYQDANMYTALYSYMQVNLIGAVWPPENFGNGFVVMTHDGGYYNFSYTTDKWVSSGDYWDVVSNIDNGWPTGLCIYISEWHWRAVRGYMYYPGTNYAICTDSAALSDNYYVSWSNWTINAALSKIVE